MLQSLSGLCGWYAQSGLADANLSIPMVETFLLFVVLTLCLLFRFSRTGLLVAYLFVYRWGWNFQSAQILNEPRMQAWFNGGYIIFGVLVFTCAVIGMIYSVHREN